MARRRCNTEDYVRNHFHGDAYIDLNCEEQSSSDPKLRKLLAKASKSGGGFPKFLLHAPDKPDFVVVIECKPDPRKHQRADHADSPDPVDYAVDGALHYAEALSGEYDVIALAVSGETSDECLISSYRWLKGHAAPEALTDVNGPVKPLLTFSEYVHLRDFDPRVRRRTHDKLMAYSRELHNFLRDYAGVSEAEKPLLVSGALIALQNHAFRREYEHYRPDHLPSALVFAVERQLEEANLLDQKLKMMFQPYSFIQTYSELAKVPKGRKHTPLRTIVETLDAEVSPLISTYHDLDVVGQFYGEFLRYHGGDKKGLGIVLTPHHFTMLMAQLIEVGPDDTVLDICAGTAGFLIAAMTEMLRQADGDLDLKERIRSQGLLGVELRPEMYALATANMLLRGDGKSSFFQGSCFDADIVKQLTDPPHDGIHHRYERATKGLLNPPFSQKGEGLKEMNFVKHLLDCLQPGGRAAVIVPVQCALGFPERKRQLLASHTLEAVMTAPGELFYPVGTHTCIMVFKAHQPHNPEVRSWFGHWKDDGFVKTKKFGRVDLDHRWDFIRDDWLAAFRERRVEPGKSVLQGVDHGMEWVAEAYMETDYSALTEQDFNTTVRDFILFCLGAGAADSGLLDLPDRALELPDRESAWGTGEEPSASSDTRLLLRADQSLRDGDGDGDGDGAPEGNSAGDRGPRVSDLFAVSYGHSLELVRLQRSHADDAVNFVSRTQKNNGVSARVAPLTGLAPTPTGTLSVALGGSVLETFVQTEPWYSGRDMAVLTPLREMSLREKLWWARCIRANRFRYSYGRQANRTLASITLPSEVPAWVQHPSLDDVAAIRRRLEGVARALAA